jgi:hypothetical protein
VNTGGACNFLFTSEIDEVADTLRTDRLEASCSPASATAPGQIFTPTVSGDLTAFTISLPGPDGGIEAEVAI